MLEILTRAVVAGMAIVRQFQLGLRAVPEAEVKGDNTLVTIVDRASGQAMKEILERELPGIPINIEDVQGSEGSGRYQLFVDPLDGTGAFAAGLSTSTVIAALYDRMIKQVTYCVVGEPATGRIWMAGEGNKTQRCGSDLAPGTYCYTIVANVPKLDRRSIVLVDVSHGFQSRGQQVFTHEQTRDFLGALGLRSKYLLPGSNGLNQAMVANGGQKMAGSITLAIGGPYDVAGARLVLSAGGVATAFSVATGKLEEVNPLDCLNYDLLVTAASSGVLTELVDLVRSVRQ